MCTFAAKGSGIPGPESFRNPSCLDPGQGVAEPRRQVPGLLHPVLAKFIRGKINQKKTNIQSRLNRGLIHAKLIGKKIKMPSGLTENLLKQSRPESAHHYRSLTSSYYYHLFLTIACASRCVNTTISFGDERLNR
jgi:hypothetical protein